MGKWRRLFVSSLRVVVIAVITCSVATTHWRRIRPAPLPAGSLIAQGLSIPGVAVTATGSQGEKPR